jgi:RimJ/RimL family protein N-acetyltransferase
VAADASRGALLLRPWLARDMPALLAEMQFEYRRGGMWSAARPRDEREALAWLAEEEQGWRDGSELIFAVLEADANDAYQLAGNVGLKNREYGGPVGHKETAEIGYWTAVEHRGRGIAPAAVRAVTTWAFDSFQGCGLREIMLVHDLDNPASCRVADKAGYPFKELSPARPPLWFTDGHIHLRPGG